MSCNHLSILWAFICHRTFFQAMARDVVNYYWSGSHSLCQCPQVHNSWHPVGTYGMKVQLSACRSPHHTRPPFSFLKHIHFQPIHRGTATNNVFFILYKISPPAMGFPESDGSDASLKMFHWNVEVDEDEFLQFKRKYLYTTLKMMEMLRINASHRSPSSTNV